MSCRMPFPHKWQDAIDKPERTLIVRRKIHAPAENEAVLDLGSALILVRKLNSIQDNSQVGGCRADAADYVAIRWRNDHVGVREPGEIALVQEADHSLL